ncbi:probable protein S-acyltransferase 17 isoform X1 [Zea mays]|uniref:S-acyltransferase n=1 Tax=Zea mays TaxID=4577 RepID=A0A804R3Z7_MAIZE|nr:uncharacterized protein LOC100284321 isoform X1 [Zea mays]|eukprot:XP_008658681.1 uncharacterized protein LOC100284321 isoform X1 [Zea mays]
MEVPWLLLVHGSVTALVVVSFLCGQWPIFEGTFIQSINHFLTFGAYHYLLRFVQSVCGTGARDLVLGVEGYCCDRPNPILQVFYVAIIGVTYFIIVQTSFQYIPGYYVSGLHRYLSVVAVSVGAILFVLTSFSDPGTVTAENVSQYVSSYPYDNIIFVEKECSTCKITRHFLICLYGALILGFILAGEIKERKIIYILTVYYGIDNSFSGLFPHVAQWLLAVHNTQILLSVFLAILALLLGGFCAYHAHLCLTNTTTNETFKWQDYIMWMKKENEAKADAATLRSSIGSANSDAQKAPPSKWRTFFMRSRTPSMEPVVRNNIYDRGMITNLCEVVVPLSERKAFSRMKSD